MIAGKDINSTIENEESGRKKGSLFWKVIRVYVVVWLIIIVALCAFIYKKASGYQKNYEAARDAINPDAVAEANLYLFDSQHFIDTLGEDKIHFNEYETEDNKNQYLQQIIPSGNISYLKVEDFNENKPAYNVMANGDVIGQIYLKKKAEADDYGFHDFEVADTVVNVSSGPLQSYTLECISGADIYINGIKVSLQESENHEELNSFVEKEAADYSGIAIYKDTYVLTDFVEKPLVECEVGGHRFTANEEDNRFVFDSFYDEGVANAIDERLNTGFINAAEAYIKNMNRYGSFDGIAMYLEVGSKAYNSIYSAQSGLSWAGYATAFKINSSEVKNVIQYGDNYLAVTTYHTTYRVFDGKEYNEELYIQWLYVQGDGKWRIRNFNLK